MHAYQVYKVNKLCTESLCIKRIYIHLQIVYNRSCKVEKSNSPLNIAEALNRQHADPLAAQSELTEAAGSARQTARSGKHRKKGRKTLSKKKKKNSNRTPAPGASSLTREDLDKAYFEGFRYGFQRAFQWITENDEFIVDID